MLVKIQSPAVLAFLVGRAEELGEERRGGRWGINYVLWGPIQSLPCDLVPDSCGSEGEHLLALR